MAEAGSVNALDKTDIERLLATLPAQISPELYSGLAPETRAQISALQRLKPKQVSSQHVDLIQNRNSEPPVGERTSNNGKIVSLSDVPRESFRQQSEGSVLDGRVIMNPAGLFQAVSNLSYEEQNAGALSPVNLMNITINSGDSASGEPAKLITVGGTEQLFSDKGNDLAEYIKGTYGTSTKYLAAVDAALQDLPEGSRVILAGHSAGAIAMLGDKGEELIKKAENEYGLEIDTVVAFGAPLVRSFGNIPGINERHIDSDGDPSQLGDTDTKFRRVAYSSDPIANFGSGNPLINQIGIIRPQSGMQTPSPIDAHTRAYANEDAFTHVDALGNKGGNTSITITGNSVTTYDL